MSVLVKCPTCGGLCRKTPIPIGNPNAPKGYEDSYESIADIQKEGIDLLKAGLEDATNAIEARDKKIADQQGRIEQLVKGCNAGQNLIGRIPINCFDPGNPTGRWFLEQRRFIDDALAAKF